MTRVRRTKDSIEADRQRDWDTLRGEGYNLFTLCLSCGEVKHCRGAARERVRCYECFCTGSKGAKVVLTLLHERI